MEQDLTEAEDIQRQFLNYGRGNIEKQKFNNN